jgi:hypothetical protein
MGVQPKAPRMAPTTMITTDRFIEAVRRAFAYLTEEFGFRLGEPGEYVVRFERNAVYVSVDYDAGRSHEITAWVGDANAAEPPLELADVLRAADAAPAEVASVELMQTGDPEAAERLLEHAADLLRLHGRPFLEGRPEAFAQARSLRSRRAAEYTRDVRNRHLLDAADEAWAQKDFARVHDLLNPIRDSLDNAHLRRLRFVEGRLRSVEGRGERGQAAAEYVGVIVLIAAILAAVAVSGIGSALTDAIEDAICKVAGDCGSGGGDGGQRRR